MDEAVAEDRSSRNREHEPPTSLASQTIEKLDSGTGAPCSTQKSNRAGTGSTSSTKPSAPAKRLKNKLKRPARTNEPTTPRSA